MPRNLLSHITMICLLSPVLAACTSVTPAGLIAASRLDPLDSDARDIAIAVGVPETVQLADGDAEFHLSYVSDTDRVEETVPLQVRAAGGAEVAPASDGEMIYIARFSPEDAARVSAAQSKIKALKAAGIAGEGTIRIAVVDACVTDPNMDTLPVSTWLKTRPEDAFVRLTREQDMLQALSPDEAQAFADGIKACP